MMKLIICVNDFFSLHMQWLFRHPRARFPPSLRLSAAPAPSQGDVTHAAVRPLPHTWAQGCLCLASAIVMDMGKRVCPSRSHRKREDLLTLGQFCGAPIATTFPIRNGGHGQFPRHSADRILSASITVKTDAIRCETTRKSQVEQAGQSTSQTSFDQKRQDVYSVPVSGLQVGIVRSRF